MKNLKRVMVVALCLLLVTGCGAKTIPTLDNGDEVITTIKGDKKISVKDLYNKLKDQYGLETLVNLIDKMILEDKYANDIDAAKDSAESTMKQLKESYKDDLLQAIQYYTNFNSLEEYQDSLYVNYLQEKAVKDYAKAQIKDSEINKYYKEKTKADIKIAHILITADYASDADEDTKNKALEEAKNKADEVIKKLNEADNKEEAFKSLASEYSKDDSTKNDGGNLGFINTNTLGDQYKNVVDKAYELKDKEYSKEAVKSELGYHVVMRLETKEKASLDSVRDSILDTLASEYTTNHNDTTVKAMQELRKEYEMDIIDSEIHDKYVNYIQSTLSQLQAQAKENSNTKTTK